MSLGRDHHQNYNPVWVLYKTSRMKVIVALMCCLGVPALLAMPLSFGSITFGSIYPVHYHLSDRYSLTQPHGPRPGSLRHVDVDNVYNGNDIIDDDSDDKSYRHKTTKHETGGYDNGDSYDGGIEDRYNKALHSAGNNDIYSNGVNHLTVGFDFGVEKRYASALKNAGTDHGRSAYNLVGPKHKVRDNFKRNGYANGKSSSGYDSNTKHGLPLSKNNIGYGKQNGLGHRGINFGSGVNKGQPSYEIAPHVADINLSGAHPQASSYTPQLKNNNGYVNQYRPRSNIHRPRRVDQRSYGRPYPPRHLSHPDTNSYPGRSAPRSYPPQNTGYRQQGSSQHRYPTHS